MSHKLVLPAMLALLNAKDVPIDGFLCPGHVSVVIGAGAFGPIVKQYKKPCVVAGFEPGQILLGLVHLLRQITEDRPELDNVYNTVVSEEGNLVALGLLERVFVLSDAPWRALGVIPRSGFELAAAFQHFDALNRFDLSFGEDQDHPACRCGEVIQGKVQPEECDLFAHECTPLTPIGPCMVSSEGTCSAWYKYGRDITRSPAHCISREIAT